MFSDQGIWFEVHESDEEENAGNNSTLRVFFDTEEDDSFGIPDKSSISFMEDEIKRFNNIEKHFEDVNKVAAIPKHEFDIIVDYFQAISNALKMAVESLKVHYLSLED